jgi:argininosuccinate lyase
MKLWQGRLSGSLDPAAARLNNSLPFDRRLAVEDVQGSLAWASGLLCAEVLTGPEAAQILQGLTLIQDELEWGEFVFHPGDEDIHTAVERRLTELIGPLAGKLHTGRSRNDQVATDFRLWVLKAITRLDEQILDLQTTLLERAAQDKDVILPGYTHFQPAQPILMGHWWLSHFWPLQRDRERLHELSQRTASLPLGAGALAGTSFPINRFALSSFLGVGDPAPNSLDAVSDRDFAAEFLFIAALTGVHLSRMAEALILFSTHEFGFITLDDAFSTGSSLMPQKKNPDPLELARGKSGSLTGNLVNLLVTLKGLPSAYDKDLQEDKVPVFESADTLGTLLPVLSGAIASLTVHGQRTRDAIDPSMLATDLADYLVQKGLPFRQAYAATGQAVRRAGDLHLSLQDLPLPEWQAIQPAFEPDLYHVFDPGQAITHRNAWGGTAPSALNDQIELAKNLLA